MTAFMQSPSTVNIPTLPEGWPIASYNTYQEAQRAVDHLADSAFPVQGITIVGVDPMLVERVAGRLTWGKVLGSAAASGAWLGLFVGLLLSLFTPGAGVAPIIIGLVGGIAFGLATSAARYAATRGQRDFVSTSQVVARRYDVLSIPANAQRGRDMLATLAMKGPQAA
ncbi:general stress protein [Umezawaea sp. Da 62-37]|uniref:general stress protein n=1 Tax=Umezawaea sp. Da 62-37 TaxID=3075927 RepID=UPI0028F6FC41|nr:general stress protein [Umezawaea sp. Da 62-37]WNV84430.1 general stress protein [Umezawaea sp. Da 62-37]